MRDTKISLEGKKCFYWTLITSTTVSTTFPQGGDFSNNAFNLFPCATFFFGKAPSFLTERKENITFGKYSFSLHFLYCHFCFFLLPGCSLSFAHYFTFGFQPCFEVTQTLWYPLALLFLRPEMARNTFLNHSLSTMSFNSHLVMRCCIDTFRREYIRLNSHIPRNVIELLAWSLITVVL